MCEEPKLFWCETRRLSYLMLKEAAGVNLLLSSTGKYSEAQLKQGVTNINVGLK